MREKLYGILSGEDHSMASFAYGCVMVAFIVASLVPLCFRERPMVFVVIETICLAVFVADYIARWATADLKLGRGALSFLIYPFTPMAIVDLVSIVPFLALLNPTWRTLRVLRLLQTLRALRLLRYSRGLALVIRAMSRQAVPLFFVCLFTAAYVLAIAIVMFNAEPETFDTYFEAVYWAVVTLATVGYGDIHPETDFGRVISIMSSLVGVAVVALPASIITGGYLEELQELRARESSDSGSKS